jgi:hypothetical protein
MKILGTMFNLSNNVLKNFRNFFDFLKICNLGGNFYLEFHGNFLSFGNFITFRELSSFGNFPSFGKYTKFPELQSFGNY